MTVLDSAQMDKAAATVAVHAYAAAMLSEKMPQGEMLKPRPLQENLMQRFAHAMESPVLSALVTGVLGLLIGMLPVFPGGTLACSAICIHIDVAYLMVVNVAAGAVVGRCTKKAPAQLPEGTFTEMEKMLPDE